MSETRVLYPIMKHIKRTVKIVLLLAACGSLRAQSLKDSTLFDEILLSWQNSITVEGAYSYRGASNISGGASGDFSSNKASATIKTQGISKSQKHALTAFVNYTYLDAHFSPQNNLFNEIHSLKASAFYAYNIDKRWSAFATGSLTFSAEQTGDWGDGMHGFAGCGAIYKFSDALSAGFGGAAYSRMDRDWIGFPVVFVDWRITERLSLRTFSGAALLYDIFGDGSLVADAACEYKNSYSRLKTGESARDSCGEFTVGATWKPCPRFFAGAHIGFDFAREMSFEKSARADVDIDAAPVFYVNLGVLW